MRKIKDPITKEDIGYLKSCFCDPSVCEKIIKKDKL